MSEEQLRFDRAAIIRELPRLVAAQGSRTQRGAQRTPLRILVELAAEVYFVHHGNARGFAGFVRSLAEEARIPCTSAMARFTIKEVREELNLKATDREVREELKRKLSRQATDKEVREELSRRKNLPKAKYVPAFDEPLRAAKRGDLLDTHVEGHDDDGDPTIGGYQPGRDPDRTASTEFASYLKKGSR